MDRLYTRDDVIESVQKISSSDIFTIFFFDCCRTFPGNSPHSHEHDQNASSAFVSELTVEQNGSGKILLNILTHALSMPLISIAEHTS